MSTLPKLHAVVEVPWFEGTPPWPWPVADRQPFSFLRVSGEMTPAEVGSVFAGLVGSPQGDAGPTVEALLSAVLADEELTLSGGIRACGVGRTINPGCCGGLENWREWLTFLESGDSPWTGHDPTPWVEWAGGTVRVWPNGGLSRTPEGVAVEFDRPHFVAELGRVGRDLLAFLPLVGAWARAVGFADELALVRKLDLGLRVTKAAADERNA